MTLLVMRRKVPTKPDIQVPEPANICCVMGQLARNSRTRVNALSHKRIGVHMMCRLVVDLLCRGLPMFSYDKSSDCC